MIHPNSIAEFTDEPPQFGEMGEEVQPYTSPNNSTIEHLVGALQDLRGTYDPGAVAWYQQISNASFSAVSKPMFASIVNTN